ncbi:MAG TPA: radical SAM protein [Anaerolineales bacterium]|nr:radical SAM protein [Anaerolineales bacterium]
MIENRGFRTIVIFGLLVSTIITAISLGLYLAKWPTWAMVVVFLVYSIIQVSLATVFYKSLYESTWLDLPKVLRKRFPPLGFGYLGKKEQEHFDVVLLRTPSEVMSGPDCGEALGLGYLVSVLRDRGLKVLFIDTRLMGLNVMQTVELLMMYQTPMLGINLNFQFLASSTQQLIEALRSRGFRGHITLGGLYASMAYEELMHNVSGIDTIVRFEGERTYLNLVENLAHHDRWAGIEGLVYRQGGQIVANPLRPLIADLDAIPNPARDFLPIARDMGGYAYVVSSRGCNGTCSYCVQQLSVSGPNGRRWRGRSAKDVVDEMQRIYERDHVRLFSFVDDDFFGARVHGKTHAEQVAEEIIRRSLDVSILLSVQPRDVDPKIFPLLKRAGVDAVILAIDNFSQPVLDRYCKFTTTAQNLKSIDTLQSLDIDAYLGIIMFDPWTTLKELAENFQIMKDLPYLRPWQILSKLETYKGSPITEKLEKLGLLTWDGYTGKYEYLDPRVRTVYQAIEVIMKILYPSSAQFDLFRWGNLSFTEVDQWILDHSKPQLDELNRNYNRQALDFALAVVNRQLQSSTPLSVMSLADSQMQKDAMLLDRITLNELASLRREAAIQKDGTGEAALASEEVTKAEV